MYFVKLKKRNPIIVMIITWRSSATLCHGSVLFPQPGNRPIRLPMYSQTHKPSTGTNYDSACRTDSCGRLALSAAGNPLRRSLKRNEALRKTHASGKTTQGTIQFSVLTVISPSNIAALPRCSAKEEAFVQYGHLYLSLFAFFLFLRRYSCDEVI